MSSSGMLRHVALVRTDVSEECSASIIRVTRIRELGTLAITRNRHTLRKHTIFTTVTRLSTINAHTLPSLEYVLVQVCFAQSKGHC
jgi:hypothetical protein